MELFTNFRSSTVPLLYPSKGNAKLKQEQEQKVASVDTLLKRKVRILAQHRMGSKGQVEVGKGMFELQASSTSRMRVRVTL